MAAEGSACVSAPGSSLAVRLLPKWTVITVKKSQAQTARRGSGERSSNAARGRLGRYFAPVHGETRPLGRS